ncbi:MAG: helix-turn-helix domain-containing protein [Burkholderiaceae bacterium]
MSQLIAIKTLASTDQDTALSTLPLEDLDNDIEHLVAANLARLRSLRHLSLDALARLSGVSRAMLAQVESGRSVPSIRVLHRVASALQVSVSAFLRDFAVDGMELLPAHASQRLVNADGSVASRSLFPAQRQLRAEFHEIRMQPASVEHLHPLLPGTCKNLVVSHGTLEIRANDQIQLLGPDDAIFFDADQSHSYRNPGNTEVLAYAVTHHPEARSS